MVNESKQMFTLKVGMQVVNGTTPSTRFQKVKTIESIVTELGFLKEIDIYSDNESLVVLLFSDKTWAYAIDCETIENVNNIFICVNKNHLSEDAYKNYCKFFKTIVYNTINDAMNEFEAKCCPAAYHPEMLASCISKGLMSNDEYMFVVQCLEKQK